MLIDSTPAAMQLLNYESSGETILLDVRANGNVSVYTLRSCKQNRQTHGLLSVVASIVVVVGGR